MKTLNLWQSYTLLDSGDSSTSRHRNKGVQYLNKLLRLTTLRDRSVAGKMKITSGSRTLKSCGLAGTPGVVNSFVALSSVPACSYLLRITGQGGKPLAPDWVWRCFSLRRYFVGSQVDDFARRTTRKRFVWDIIDQMYAMMIVWLIFMITHYF